MTTFPYIEDLLLHRPPNLLVSEVLAWSEDSILAAADIRSGQWYSTSDGAMPAWIGIELMAQAVAAFVGLEARNRGRPAKIGYLLGTREYTCALGAFPAGERVEIGSRLVFRDESGLGAFDCALKLRGETVAEVTLKVYEEPDRE